MTDEPKAPESGRWQFSLRTLMMGVVFVAVGSLALANADKPWVLMLCVIYTAIAILYSTYLGFRVRGRTGKFAVAFASSGSLTACVLLISTCLVPRLIFRFVEIFGVERGGSLFEYVVVAYCLLILFLGYVIGLIAGYTEEALKTSPSPNAG